MKRNSKVSRVMSTALFAVLGGAADVCAQEKYSLKSPSGIAFADFKGYEDWAVVSSARTDEALKVGAAMAQVAPLVNICFPATARV